MFVILFSLTYDDDHKAYLCPSIPTIPDQILNTDTVKQQQQRNEYETLRHYISRNYRRPCGAFSARYSNGAELYRTERTFEHWNMCVLKTISIYLKLMRLTPSNLNGLLRCCMRCVLFKHNTMSV